MPGEPWLILPTYNEAENIEAITSAAGGVLARAAPQGYRVLVVDDGSPDGTGQIADRLAAEHDWLEVLHRAEKNGIGPAYLAGFRRALDGGAGTITPPLCLPSAAMRSSVIAVPTPTAQTGTPLNR